MNNLLIYFIKSGIAMALLYGVYRIFLEKETHYSLNRFYLVGSVLLSLLLPVLPLERLMIAPADISVPSFMIGIDQAGTRPAGYGTLDPAVQGFQIDGAFLGRFVYLSGIGLLLLSFVFQLFRLIMIRIVGKEKHGPLQVNFVNRKVAPFSILNRVYVHHGVRSDPKLDTILQHEYAHYRLLHFVDLLLMEFVTIFQWFNPIAWLVVKSLKEIHEYQADADVISTGEGTGTYQALLVNQLTGAEVFRLANEFSKSLTRKRMIMMTRMKSKKSAWLKVFAAMPVLAILVIAYAFNSQAQADPASGWVVKGKVLEAASGDPMPGVSIIWKGTTSGTITDKDGNFRLEVSDKEAVVTYSFVGYQTVETQGAGEFTVKMEKKVYRISGDWKEVEESSGKKKKPVQEGIEPPAGEDAEVFFIVEDMPKFQGENFEACRPYVQEHREYPAKAKDQKIQGLVYVTFTVNAKGEVKDAKVVRGVDPMLDLAALKAVQGMPRWTPGMQRGKPVAVQFTIPVEFSLETD